MRSKYYNDERTTGAWNALTGRLKRDGLLQEPGTEGEKERFPFRRSPVYIYLRAAAAVALIAAISLFVVRSFRENEGERITIGNLDKSSVYVTRLQDGSAVYLSEYASLTYPRSFAKEIREVTLTGDAYFQVEPDKEVPFVINAGLIRVKVLGTSFRVGSVQKGEQSLAVESGRVRVTLISNGMETEIHAGEELLVSGDNMEKIPAFDSRQFDRYRDKMRFKDERLSDVAEIINRNSDGVVIEIDPSVSERMLTATFCENSPEAMARLIALALELSYTREGDVIRIY